MSADESFHALVSGRARGWRPALARLGLSAASGPYASAVWLRNRLYDRGWKRIQRAAVPLVSGGGRENNWQGGTDTPGRRALDLVLQRLRATAPFVQFLSNAVGLR